MTLAIVPYFIHSDVQELIDKLHIKTFNLNHYIYDDIDNNCKFLKTLDPKDWKNQDHYAVLRLKSIRNNASPELLKQAYRKQVLHHHPDKGKSRLNVDNNNSGDANNDYFVCITRAYEILSDITKRRSYDSVDPNFDDEIPTAKEVKDDFFSSLDSVFEANSRWSKKQPVPLLGEDNTRINDVWKFYEFWENFESWREWSYILDKDKEEAENREERRWQEKQLKGEKKRLREEEFKRIRSLVELAKKNDPRIKRENERWKQQKETEKKEKEERRQKRIDDALQLKKEEHMKLEQEEAEKQRKLKEEADIVRKEKDQLKNKLKTEKRRLKKFVESRDSFSTDLEKESDNRSLQLRKAEFMNNLDFLCQVMTIEKLTALNETLQNTERDQECLNFLRKAALEARSDSSGDLRPDSEARKENKPSSNGSSASNVSRCGDRDWDYELTQLLIRAINTHPPGTKSRWSVVSHFMNSHQVGLGISEKQVIFKAKSLKSNDPDMKKEAAAHSLETKSELKLLQTVAAAAPIQITDRLEADSGVLAWSADEQKRLEAALREFPTALGVDRWQQISNSVGTRTRKECMLRFKSIAERLKAGKTAASRA